MVDVTLLLWDFKDAPPQFRRLLPCTCVSGWVAFVCAGSSAEIVEVLVARWRRTGRTVLRYDIEQVGIVLAGPHAADQRPESSAADTFPETH